MDVDRLTSLVKPKLSSLKITPLIGGWVAQLKEQMKISNNGDSVLKDVLLHSTTPRQNKEHHKFVTVKRDLSAIQTEIIDSLVEFLTQRFSIDQQLTSIVKPFASLMPEADVKSVHATISSDLDLQTLNMEYNEVMEMVNIETVRKAPLRDIVSLLSPSEHYVNVTTTLARILAAKPHSADVERLISCSNLLKTPDRSKMLLSTENLYLYVHYNMPPLSLWNPRHAVLLWLNKSEHRVSDRPKGKKQYYFTGVFSEAKKKAAVNTTFDGNSKNGKKKF